MAAVRRVMRQSDSASSSRLDQRRGPWNASNFVSSSFRDFRSISRSQTVERHVIQSCVTAFTVSAAQGCEY